MSKTYKSEGIVLKRFNFSEADRIVTIFTLVYGKITVIAKGVRRPTSKKKASIEPATQAIFFCARGKKLDILTQTKLINSFSSARKSLARLTQIYQMLEIVDLLTADSQQNPQVYKLLENTLKVLEDNGSKKKFLLSNIRLIIKDLGFTSDKQFTEVGLKNYIEELAEKKLKSKSYLTPQIAMLE